jgi:hypothetical protein
VILVVLLGDVADEMLDDGLHVADLGEIFVGGSGPEEWFRVEVPGGGGVVAVPDDQGVDRGEGCRVGLPGR